MFSRLQSLANRRVILILVLVFLVLMGLVFPLSIARLTELSGGVSLIDMEFGYTPAKAYQMIEAYGPEGRSLYILTSLTADLLYPLDYALLGALVILASYRRAFSSSKVVRWVVWIPFLAAGFDLLENASLVTLLASYPARLVWLAQAAGFFTTVKWWLVVCMVILVLVGLAGLGVSALRRRAA